eukprot:NODE_195_length_13287_cov_0.482484.p9 type:complete len:212 gc:universal NODE_195_length_13287_cov_0.482484:4367-3732(-)
MESIAHENQLLRKTLKKILRFNFLNEHLVFKKNDAIELVNELVKRKDSGISFLEEPKQQISNANTQTDNQAFAKALKTSATNTHLFKLNSIQVQTDQIKSEANIIFEINSDTESDTSAIYTNQFSQTDYATKFEYENLHFQLEYLRRVNQDLKDLLLSSNLPLKKTGYQMLLERYNHSLYIIEQQQIELLNYRRIPNDQEREPDSPNGVWV